MHLLSSSFPFCCFDFQVALANAFVGNVELTVFSQTLNTPHLFCFLFFSHDDRRSQFDLFPLQHDGPPDDKQKTVILSAPCVGTLHVQHVVSSRYDLCLSIPHRTKVFASETETQRKDLQ